MMSASTGTRFVRAPLAVVSVAVALLVSVAGSAGADAPTVFRDDSTGFVCEDRPADRPALRVTILSDAVSGEGFSEAEVVSADGEVMLATGFTDQVQVGGGVVSARYPLLFADGSAAGEVVLDGTYVAIAEPATMRV